MIEENAREMTEVQEESELAEESKRISDDLEQ